MEIITQIEANHETLFMFVTYYETWCPQIFNNNNKNRWMSMRKFVWHFLVVAMIIRNVRDLFDTKNAKL